MATFLTNVWSARDTAFTNNPAKIKVDGTHTLQEYLKGDVVTKIYLDYDEVLHDHKDPNKPPEDSFVKERRAQVVKQVEKIIEALKRSTQDLGDIKFTMAERNGYCTGKQAWKLSYRPYLHGICVVYHKIPVLLQVVKCWDPTFWDETVYKRTEQLLVAIGSTKTGRVLKVGHLRSRCDHSPLQPFLS